MITRRQFAIAVLALAIITSIVYILAGCSVPDYPAKKVTQGNRTWVTCHYVYGAGYFMFYDQDGKLVRLYGDTVIEDSDDYTCKDGVPVKK